MTILLDMDDVLDDLLPAWVDWLNKKYGTDVKPENVREWEMTKSFPTLTQEEVYGALQKWPFWLTVKPKKGAVETVKKLIDEGNDVFVVTSSYYKTVYVKMEAVLFKYFPFIDWDHVILTNHKQMVRGDVLVDDGVHNLIGGNYAKILMDMPQNRDFDESSEGMLRAYSWDDVYQYIHTNGG